MHLRGQDVADKGVAQRDQVHVGRNKKRRQLLERDRTAPVDKDAAMAKLVFNTIGLGANGVEPKLQAVPRLTEIF